MVMTILKRAFSVLMKKPLTLWGISLLNILLSLVFSILFGVIPGLSLGISILLSTSMTMVFLHGYRGETVSCKQLFDCFKDWDTIKRVLCGMGWMALWVFLWSLIPVVGFVFAIIKTYAYRLTPYILVTEPDVPIMEAYRVSEARTRGYKGKMFGAEILFFAAIFVAFFVLGLFAAIPYIGILFGIVIFVLYIAVFALAPLFMGLVGAAFYEEISNPTIPVAPSYPTKTCTNCGSQIAQDSSFCPICGKQQ